MAVERGLKPKGITIEQRQEPTGGYSIQDRKYKTKGSDYRPGRKIMPRGSKYGTTKAELTPDEMPAEMRRKLEEEQNV